MKSALAIVLCFLTAMAQFAIHCSGQCSFEYLSQPHSTTLQDCNPYNNDSVRRILITLDCVVRRAIGFNTSYSIRWFRENTTGPVKDLGIGDPIDQLSTTDQISRYHDTAFFNQPYSPSLLGKYWCQVITTADPDQPLMRSNVFTLLAPGNYSGPACTGVQTVTNVTCADISVIFSTSIATVVSTMYPSQADTLATLDRSTTPLAFPTSLPVYTSVNQRTTSHPSPTVPGMQPSTPLTIAVVSAGVVLVLLLVIVCSSTLIVILIVMKRRKRNKQQLHSGGYSNNAVSYNNCTKDNINLQPNNTATITSPQQPAIYDQPDELKRTMSAASKGGNVINSEYSCLTDATTSGPPPAAAPVLFDDPMYDAAGVNDNQYSHLENAVTGGDTCYSKLGYNQAATTNTLPTVTGDDQYSSLNTSSNTVGRGDSSKLAAGYGEQEYSSLQHRGVPAAPSDMVGHTTADQQQYSVLNK